ncbi:MAG TPA: LuxR C-terminal-related transcriptional regulator [Nitrospiraceae bacterium]|jgi:DNA-binding CsgD family transcriptional regulator|nr:LuxR C-terminal-related transcriptional regulator [Nitrospiraceae bacterium]
MSTTFSIDETVRRDVVVGLDRQSEEDKELGTNPGILILSGDDKVLHINHTAWVLLQQLHKAEGKTAHGLFPSAIKDICLELRHILDGNSAGTQKEHFEARRVASGVDHGVLLNGLVLPSSNGSQGDRLLIVMHAVASPLERAMTAKERFQLSEREYVVVQRLAKGWTNKEIGNDLGIHESTVKAHMAHIMQKTKCTTRTGIVALFLVHA